MAPRIPDRRDSFYTSHEVSRLCGVAPITVGRWISAGKLRAFRTVGGHRRILKSDFEDFIAEHGIPVMGCAAPDGPRKVLVVDDDQVMVRVLADMIGTIDGSWDVRGACDGFDAGRQVEAFRPHLVFLDLMMPGMDGFEVCRRIKSDARTGHTEIIGLTGYFTPENRTRLIEYGAADLLRKPISLETLAELLGRVFEAHAEDET